MPDPAPCDPPRHAVAGAPGPRQGAPIGSAWHPTDTVAEFVLHPMNQSAVCAFAAQRVRRSGSPPIPSEPCMTGRSALPISMLAGLLALMMGMPQAGAQAIG